MAVKAILGAVSKRFNGFKVATFVKILAFPIQGIAHIMGLDHHGAVGVEFLVKALFGKILFVALVPLQTPLVVVGFHGLDVAAAGKREAGEQEQKQFVCRAVFFCGNPCKTREKRANFCGHNMIASKMWGCRKNDGAGGIIVWGLPGRFF